MKGGRATYGQRILVTVSRELAADDGRPWKGPLDAKLEGVPA